MRSFGAFDFLVVAYLNIGNFYNRQPCLAGRCATEFYTFPVNFVKKHHDTSGWEKFKLGSVKIDEYKDDKGFELIAKALAIKYPSRPKQQ
jgi:hypothetical protein